MRMHVGIDGPAAGTGKVKLNRAASTRERVITFLTVCVPGLALLASVPYAIFLGIRPLSLLLLLVMYCVTIAGVGIGYHRLAAHQSFKASVATRVVLAVAGSLAAQGPVLHWASAHRHHHPTADRPDDFHSPKVSGPHAFGRAAGLFHAHVGWLFGAYTADGWVFRAPYADWTRYIPDLLKDRALCKVNKHYFDILAAGLLGPALLAGLVTLDPLAALDAFFWAGLVRIAIVQNCTWSVNSVCHVWGTRPFRARDLSANNALIALITFGEGWHNNHHAFPTSFRHGLRWWEFDLNAAIVLALARARLAWDLRQPSPEHRLELLAR
jgi:stearoyl-CoA desaturase (Delta-9 desaturase)